MTTRHSIREDVRLFGLRCWRDPKYALRKAMVLLFGILTAFATIEGARPWLGAWANPNYTGSLTWLRTPGLFVLFVVVLLVPVVLEAAPRRLLHGFGRQAIPPLLDLIDIAVPYYLQTTVAGVYVICFNIEGEMFIAHQHAGASDDHVDWESVRFTAAHGHTVTTDPTYVPHRRSVSIPVLRPGSTDDVIGVLTLSCESAYHQPIPEFKQWVVRLEALANTLAVLLEVTDDGRWAHPAQKRTRPVGTALE
jgi:hypothetical protein